MEDAACTMSRNRILVRYTVKEHVIAKVEAGTRQRQMCLRQAQEDASVYTYRSHTDRYMFTVRVRHGMDRAPDDIDMTDPSAQTRCSRFTSAWLNSKVPSQN